MTKESFFKNTFKLMRTHLLVWWECSFPGHGNSSAFCLPLTHIDRNRRRDLITSLILSLLVVAVVFGIVNFPSRGKAEPPRVPIKTSIVPTQMPPAKKRPPPPTPPDVVIPPLPYIPPPKVVVPPLKNALKEKVTHIKPVKQPEKPKKIKKKVVKRKLTKAPTTVSQQVDDDDADAANDDSEKNHSAGAVPINGARPEYPPNAEDDNREGKVVAACDILPSGHTANCKIVSHTGGSDFVASAMDFLARARYEPSVENGQPVTEHGHMLTIDFTLGD
ncbi:energy transducer TonB [Acetobacteraceae bacterium]|nr:energy transducer TonB [Acetobacteraceae bacterium]